MTKASYVLHKYAGVGSLIRTGLKATTPALSTAGFKATHLGTKLLNEGTKINKAVEIGNIVGSFSSPLISNISAATLGNPAPHVVAAPLLAGGQLLSRAAQRLSNL